jgi:four helix bundle protein
MGRVQPEFLERVESFGDRVVDVAEALAEQRRSRRITDQITGAGTSVGANTAEADEAQSRREFCKCLGIAKRELAETQYWLRFVARRAWIAPDRLISLAEEAVEIKRVMGSIIERTRANDRVPERSSAN